MDARGSLVTQEVESVCSFKSPGRHYDVLTISPDLIELGHGSMSLDYSLAVDDTEIATGCEVRVFVANHGATLAKVPIAAEIQVALEKQIA